MGLRVSERNALAAFNVLFMDSGDRPAACRHNRVCNKWFRHCASGVVPLQHISGWISALKQRIVSNTHKPMHPFNTCQMLIELTLGD